MNCTINRTRRVLVGLFVCSIALAGVAPAFAQEVTPPPTNGSAGWIVYFLLVIGLLAIGLVGLSTISGRGLQVSFASNEPDEELSDETTDAPIPAMLEAPKLEVPKLE